MTLSEYEKQFLTKEQCLNYLYKLRFPNGFRCGKCGHTEMWEVSDYKYKCKKCGYQMSVTAGTLFHHIHLPIEKWFKAIWYICERSNIFTLNDLINELHLGSSNTAREISYRIRNAISIIEQPIKLKGTIEASTEMRRGILYIVAVEIDDEKAGRVRALRLSNMDEIVKFLHKYIEIGSVIFTDMQSKFLSDDYKIVFKEDFFTSPHFHRAKSVYISNNLKEHNKKCKFKLDFEELIYTFVKANLKL